MRYTSSVTSGPVHFCDISLISTGCSSGNRQWGSFCNEYKVYISEVSCCKLNYFEFHGLLCKRFELQCKPRICCEMTYLSSSERQNCQQSKYDCHPKFSCSQCIK